MKIDLHVHTKKTAVGDGNDREICADDFKKKMTDANVGIVAITNHNFFCRKHYYDYCDENSYMLLPGVEFDTVIDGKYKQLNIICNPKVVKKFDEKVNGIIERLKNSKGFNREKRNPVDIDHLIDEFDAPDTIFLVDYKNNKWKIEKAEEKFKGIEGILVFDTSNTWSRVYLHSKDSKDNPYSERRSFMGSDCKEWKKYVDEDSKDLVDIPFDFRDGYEWFVKALKGKSKTALDLIINTVRKEKNLPSLSIDVKETKEIKNLKISNGINVIFGAKATGKTKLLEAIHNDKSYLKAPIYHSSDFDKEYKQILKCDDFPELEKFKAELKEIVKWICDYEDPTYNKFPNFYLSAISQNIKIKIQEKKVTKVEETKGNTSHEEIIDTYKKLLKELKEELKGNTNGDDLYTKHQDLFKETVKYLKETHLNKNRDWHSYLFCDKVQNRIDSTKVEVYRVPSTPNDVGLEELFDKRLKLKKKVEEYRKLVEKVKTKDKNDPYDMPTGNKWVHSQKLYLLGCDPEKGIPSKASLPKDFDNENAAKMRRLYKDSLKIFMKWDLWEWSNELDGCISECKNIKDEYLYVIHNYFKDTMQSGVEPSTGEKAFIVLFNYLRGDFNTIFLDEPEAFLGEKMISDHIVPKLLELSKMKRIIMTTHSSPLGVNTLPFNYIYKEVDNNKYNTYVGYVNEKNPKLKGLSGNSQEKDLFKEMLDHFEGSEDSFIFRMEVYGKQSKFKQNK